MPKGEGKGAKGSDEVVYEPYDVPGSEKDFESDYEEAMEDREHAAEVERPYYESEAVESAIEKAVEKQKGKQRDRVEIVSPEEEEPVPSKGTRENVFLYINTGIGQYTLVDHPFDSKAEATKYAKEVYPDTKYKAMTETEVKAYMAKLEKRAERVEKVKEGAKKAGADVAEAGRYVGRGLKRMATPVGRASMDVARSHGMTREQMEPRIKQAWGVPPYEEQPRGRPPISRPKYPPTNKYGRPMQPLRAPDFEPAKPPESYEREIQRRQEEEQAYRESYRQPRIQQQPRSRFRIQAPPQRRTGFHIPPGGGVFGSRIQPPKKGPFEQTRRGPAPKPPFKSMKFDFSGGMHMARPHWVGGQPRLRRPYEEEQQIKKKVKKISRRAKTKKTKIKKKSKKKKGKK